MTVWHILTTWLVAALPRLHDHRNRDDRDRGDVPGWVLVTVMSAILVVAILGVFEPQIKDAISHALSSVTSSK
jgi:hypothetical protein